MKPPSTGGPDGRTGRSPQTDEAIRAATDRGELGDKVNFPDPAMAPLGTDAEAAGAPSPAAGAEARQAPNDVPRPNDTNNRSSAPVLILVGFVVTFALVLWLVMS